jgi:hypothetical protein
MTVARWDVHVVATATGPESMTLGVEADAVDIGAALAFVAGRVVEWGVAEGQDVLRAHVSIERVAEGPTASPSEQCDAQAVEAAARALHRHWEIGVRDDPTPWAEAIDATREYWRRWARIALAAASSVVPQESDAHTVGIAARARTIRKGTEERSGGVFSPRDREAVESVFADIIRESEETPVAPEAGDDLAPRLRHLATSMRGEVAALEERGGRQLADERVLAALTLIAAVDLEVAADALLRVADGLDGGED